MMTETVLTISSEIIAAVGDLPAGEGFGAVLGAALNGLLALALIFGVLIVMDQVRKKKEVGKPSDEPDGTPAPKEKEKGDNV